jgi:hypothetical protein
MQQIAAAAQMEQAAAAITIATRVQARTVGVDCVMNIRAQRLVPIKDAMSSALPKTKRQRLKSAKHLELQ